MENKNNFDMYSQIQSQVDKNISIIKEELNDLVKAEDSK